MTTTFPVSIQINCWPFVKTSNDIPVWTTVSKNQRTVATVVAEGLGGYGRVVR
jgi:hypothetical protein